MLAIKTVRIPWYNSKEKSGCELERERDRQTVRKKVRERHACSSV